jgi:hypothetical protein
VRKSAVLLLLAVAVLLSACGGGGSSSSSSSGSSSTAVGAGDAGQSKGPEQVWAKEVEGVMRKFENTSSRLVSNLHTSTSKSTLEPTYATYSDELAKLGKQLEATDPPAACEQLRDRMGVLAKKVSQIMGVLGNQHELSPEEFSALAYQQGFKFSRVGRQLTNATIHPHC